MHEVVEIIRNDAPKDLAVVLEPWGEAIALSARHTFRVVVRAPEAGNLEIVRQNHAVIVYAWPGATVQVFDRDRRVAECAIPVPPVPAGKSVRQFLGLMGFVDAACFSPGRKNEETFWKRILQRQPRLATQVCRDGSKHWCRVSLSPPRWPGHALYLGDLETTSATVCYDDGSPPGPAEAHFDWGNPDNTSSAIDVMCDYAEDVIQGRRVLIRERLSRVVQFLRRHDCDSLLWFAEREKFESMPARRRSKLLRAWSWTESILPGEPA